MRPRYVLGPKSVRERSAIPITIRMVRSTRPSFGDPRAPRGGGRTMTIRGEKVVGGLSCSDVLARLSDYVDGELSSEERARVETHLRGCDGCARFGGEFRATVEALRAHLEGAAEVPRDLTERLRAALDAEPRRR
jgi:hypothetical protein